MGFGERHGRPIPSWTVPVSIVVLAQVSGSATDSGALAVVSFSGDGSPSSSPGAQRLESVEFGGNPGSDGTSSGP